MNLGFTSGHRRGAARVHRRRPRARALHHAHLRGLPHGGQYAGVCVLYTVQGVQFWLTSI